MQQQDEELRDRLDTLEHFAYGLSQEICKALGAIAQDPTSQATKSTLYSVRSKIDDLVHQTWHELED